MILVENRVVGPPGTFVVFPGLSKALSVDRGYRFNTVSAKNKRLGRHFGVSERSTCLKQPISGRQDGLRPCFLSVVASKLLILAISVIFGSTESAKPINVVRKRVNFRVRGSLIH